MIDHDGIAPPLTWLEASAELKQGDRVVFVEAHDIFPEAHVPAGTMGTVEENGLNEIWCTLSVRPDDEALSDALAEWDGCIYLSPREEAGEHAWHDKSPVAPALK